MRVSVHFRNSKGSARPGSNWFHTVAASTVHLEAHAGRAAARLPQPAEAPLCGRHPGLARDGGPGPSSPADSGSCPRHPCLPQCPSEKLLFSSSPSEQPAGLLCWVTRDQMCSEEI